MGASVTYPNFAGKHAHDAFFNPSDFVEYQRFIGRLDGYEPPAGVLLCYRRSLYDAILDEAQPTAHRRLMSLRRTDNRVGVVFSGVGAPAAASIVEDVGALGTTRFLSIGLAGSLQHACPIGHTIVCDGAIRDEGVSHHYLPPAKYISASSGITNELRAELERRDIGHSVGRSWTIDTPYRETVAEAHHYQDEGVLCVEMEAAALFAVAQFRGYDIGCAFVVSDSLADLVWDPQFQSDAVGDALTNLCDAAVEVLAR